MKSIFKNFAAALVACVAMLSVSSVFAGVGKTFPPTPAGLIACENSSSHYEVTPWPANQRKPAWFSSAERFSLPYGQCVLMNTTTRLVNTSGPSLSGYSYVFQKAGTEFVENEGRWLNAKCLNDTSLEMMPVQPAQRVAQVATAPQPVIAQTIAVAAAPAPAAAPPVPAAPEVCISCMLVEHNRIGKESCDKLEGVFTQATSLKPEGAYRCDYPRGYGQFTPNTGSHTAPVHTVTNQAPRLVDNRQAYTVAVPQGPALVIQQAPAPVQVQTQCNNNCSYRPVARVVNSVPGAYCGIHTTDGRKFKLVRNDGRAAGALMLVDISAGVDGRAMAITQYNVDQQGWDCNKAQTAVETQHWAGVTNFFALPNACQVASRVNGRMQ